MKDDTLLLIGGLGIGAFILYKSGILQNLGKVANVVGTTSDTISSGVSGVSSDISAINTAVAQDLSTFNTGVEQEIKNISTIFGNITGTISDLTTQLKQGITSTPSAVTGAISTVVKDVESVFTPSSSSSSATSSSSGGGTLPISQQVTGGYTVQTAQGGVSYASGTGPQATTHPATTPLSQKNTATSFFGG